MLEALGDAKGWAWDPDWPGDARMALNGLDCTPVPAGALFYLDPGIQGMAQVGGDLMVLGPTINLTTA